MTASLAGVSDPASDRQVFLEEFVMLLDSGVPVADICRRLNVQPGAVATRLRRAARTDLYNRWMRRCRAAGVEV